MSAKAAFYTLAAFVLITVGCVYALRRPGTHIQVDTVTKRQKFLVPYTYRMAAIDPPAPVRVRGYLDGKAAIYQERGGEIDSRGLPVWAHKELLGPNPYLLRLKPGKIDTTISCMTGTTDFFLIYQPLMAKNGELTIDVDY